MTSDDEREVIAEVPLRNLTAEHERAMKAEQRATAAEGEVETLTAERDILRDKYVDADCRASVLQNDVKELKELLAAERRLKDAAVGALRTRWERWLRVENAHRDNDDARETFARICNLDRATFDELGISDAGDGT